MYLVVATQLLFLVPAITCSTHSTHYVKPTPDTTCPTEPCHTLSEYAQQLPHNLTSNTTLLLLPGDHVLSVNFRVESVSSFEICVRSFPPTNNRPKDRVVCKGLVGFIFYNVSSLTLESLTFTSCGKGAVGYDPLPDNFTIYYGILIILGDNIMIFNCSFKDSFRTALGVFYSSLHLHGNIFTNNGPSSGSDKRWVTGGFTDTSTFRITRNNSANYNTEKNCTSNSTGTIAFRNNSVEYFGGVYAYNSTLNIPENYILVENSDEYGGGIRALSSNLNLTGNNIFSNNSAKYGGGMYAYNSTLDVTGNFAFEENSAEYGGGIRALNSILDLTASSSFTHNTAEYYGGGIYMENSTLISTGNSTFKDNTARQLGGGISAEESTLKFTGNNTFRGNLAVSIGGGVRTFSSTLNFTGNTTFMNNSAEYGGGITASYSTLTITGITAFIYNNAKYRGGSIYIWIAILNIVGYSIDSSTGKFYGDCNGSCTLLFMDNSAEFFGGAVYTLDSTINIEGCNSFSRNSARCFGGGVHSENSTLRFSGNTNFSSNSALHNGGGIHGVGTSLYLSGTSTFTANTAGRGGGEYLANSFILLSKNAAVIMDNNSAKEYGGAMYVEDSYEIAYCASNFLTWNKCLFQTYELFEIPHFTPSNFTYAVTTYFNIHLHFYNNVAQIAGSSVYGGSLDVCRICVYCKFANSHRKYEWFKMHDILNIELEENSVSSDPFQVCLCKDGTPSCNTSEDSRQAYPGQLLQIPAVAVGQNTGLVPAVVRANFTGNTSLAQFQDTQKVKKRCTDLHYRVHSSIVNNNDTLVLYADGPCSTAGKSLSILVHFLPCPAGFSLNSSDSICKCEPRLQKYTIMCNITERTLTRQGEFWVGYDNYCDIILHPHCPFDYCKPATGHISFPLNNTDLQCENNRSGILCGECKSGLSLALGSSKCLHCTNIHLLLLLPFALAGIALVLLLFMCKLTVAAGTINGLIFYSNIVSVNRAIFFPPNQTNILTVFISWVNLDLGIEACFFDGMDEYSKTWLQFIFPLYVWSLVVLIIIASYYSPRISRLFGSNPVAVLVTLFLLSYGKLLRAVITAMFFTNLDYPNGVKVAVWLCDGNIRYLRGKHIALFLVALLTLLIFLLPYTLLLTVGQRLQANSNRRFFHWINNPTIKPFLDAYQAPYRDKHRYWTGLSLCLRCALFLVFAINTQANPSINLLAISSVAFGLILVTRYTGAVYRKLYVDILEASFTVNLGFLAVATYYVKLAVATYYVKLAVVPVNQAAVANASAGIALSTFIGVVIYHTYLQVWPKLQQRVRHLCDHEESESSNDSTSEEERNASSEPPTLVAPTTTIVDPPCPELGT